VAENELPEDGAAPATGRWSRRTIGVGVTVAVAVLLGMGFLLLPGGDDAPSTAAPAPSTAATTPSATPAADRSVDTDPTAGTTGYPPVSAAEAGERLAAAQADLARLSAQLTEPVVLTSPTTWDQWLPGMKPYPGTSTADDIATCPTLSDGLTAALGHRMSYWVGTLPMGPVGCTWAPVPLQYDTIDYPFTVSVGFLGDGTTAADVARTAVTVLHGDQPRSCPTTQLPGGGELSECWSVGSTSLQLAVPDARGAGLWVLSADAHDDGPVTTEDAFRAVLDGVTRNYG
jgi:hypothetical protein